MVMIHNKKLKNNDKQYFCLMMIDCNIDKQ